MSMLVFHIFFWGWGLGRNRTTIGAREMFSTHISRQVALLLSANSLDDEPFFLGVNQIIPRPNASQTSDPIPRLFQTFNSHYPNRSSISKLFENIKFRRHFEAPA
jgi:hypothetical protein